MGICPKTTNVKAVATTTAAMPVSSYMSAKKTAWRPATDANTVRTA